MPTVLKTAQARELLYHFRQIVNNVFAVTIRNDFIVVFIIYFFLFFFYILKGFDMFFLFISFIHIIWLKFLYM